MTRPVAAIGAAFLLVSATVAQVQVGDILVVRHTGVLHHLRSDGTLVRTVTGPGGHWGGGSFSQDGEIMLTRNAPRPGLVVLNGTTGSVLLDLDVAVPPPRFAHTVERLRNGDYVFDHGWNNAVRLDAQGAVIGTVILPGLLIRHGSALDSDGNFWLATGGTGSSARIVRCDRDAQIQSQFSVPYPTGDIDVAPDGTIWIANLRGRSVQQRNANGQPLGGFDLLPGPSDLHSIAVAPDGSILTATYDGTELVRYSPTGVPLETIPIPAGSAVTAIDVAFGNSSIGVAECGPAVPNSTGDEATLRALGSPRVADERFSLAATGLPPAEFGLWIHSQTAALVPNARGAQGTLCLGGSLVRQLAVVGTSSSIGAIVEPVNLQQLPTGMGALGIAPGETWRFQLWYRDENPNSTTNFTNAVAVLFE